jgi:23S rRNA (uracil1939-C5)-methyltransferase
VEDHLAQALPADVVVLNPPRGGVERAVTDVLSAAVTAPNRPRLLVYVSCDPATLARDVSRLVGWRVEHVHCFDMFPQTAHVETVCVLRPEAL